MYITDYRYIHGTEDRSNYIAIPELDRYQSSVKQFIKLANLDIQLTKPTAFIYVEGFSISQAESGIGITPDTVYTPAIKMGSSYILHEWVYTFKGKEHLVHANIISSTCASGIQALYEADRLMKEGVAEEVIIIGGERTTEDTLRLFKELLIPVVCGDGFFYMKVSNKRNSLEDHRIIDIKWKYAFSNNPFMFSRETLDTLLPKYPVDFIKLHGTGTKSNNEAEAGLEASGTPLRYKHLIGHTQGVSSLLETCIVLTDPDIKGKVLVTANGLGGYYGSFILVK